MTVELIATRELVEEVMRTSMALENIVHALLGSLPDDHFPDEDPALVLLEMIVGSSHPATTAAGPTETSTATALVVAIRERVLTDLHAAALLLEREETTEKS
jgi:hypothetical protein